MDLSHWDPYTYLNPNMETAQIHQMLMRNDPLYRERYMTWLQSLADYRGGKGKDIPREDSIQTREREGGRHVDFQDY